MPATPPGPFPQSPSPQPHTPRAGRQLARRQAAVLLVWALVLFGWLARAWLQASADESPAFSLAMAAVTLTAHAVWLGVAMALAQWHNRNDPAPPARVAQAVQAWLGEVRHAVAVFGWRQPFFPDAEPDHLPFRPPSGLGPPGVLLVHGYVCNRGFWAPWVRRLRAEGVPVMAVTLEPVAASIDAYAPQIEAAVRQLEAATGQPPLLVGHSMGGLAIRAWRRAFDVQPERVRGVVSLGTPHRGTWLAQFAHTRNGRQMSPDSLWLRHLAASEPPEWLARWTCWYSHCDCIVFPASRACLPGAEARHQAGVAHLALAFDSAVLAFVRRRLRG